MKYYIRNFDKSNKFFKDFLFKHVKDKELKFLYSFGNPFTQMTWNDREFPRNKNQLIYENIPAIDRKLEDWEVVKYKLLGYLDERL